MDPVACLSMWRDVRAELVEELAAHRPRSRARLICEIRLRAATTACLALEVSARFAPVRALSEETQHG